MPSTVSRRRWVGVILALVASSPALATETVGGLPKSEAERLIQIYLAMWSTDAGINPQSVGQFYAPRVTYYGKSFSRSAVLDDKRAYIKQWPSRVYRETPGSVSGACNAEKTVCRMTFVMDWRRVSRSQAVSTGRARVSLTFVPVEGRHKIVHESAQIL